MKNLSIIIGTVAFLLLCGLAGRYISDHWLFFTFASFQIQGAAVAAGLAALAWLLHRNVVASLLVIAALAIGAHGYVMLGDFRHATPAPPPNWPTDLKLMSFNIRGDNSFENGGSIADAMIASGADVVMIQESAPLGPHIERIKQTYPYRLGCGAQTITCDQSLWSKTPLAAGEVKTASPIYRDRLLLAAIEIGGKRINFANVHTTKPYFDNLHAIELKRIGEEMTDFASRNPGPFVVAGDYNASILTPDIRRFVTQMKLMTAPHEPSTWPVEAPTVGMAIDHVFVSDPLRFKSLNKVPETMGSNHFGLVAEIWYQDLTITYPPD
ncbi:MAG: endonuclease/exonuclease/phosphatase family protein [Rhizobium sp.]|nr:endonuclease/exonuclease/phosphatase family protein [Rhizobium sp.]